MEQASAALAFDKAAYYRDKIREFENQQGTQESILGNYQAVQLMPEPKKTKLGRKKRKN